MKCFIALEEALLEELWMKHPELIAPFSRPFFPRSLSKSKVQIVLEAKAALVHEIDQSSANDEHIQTIH